MRGEMNEWDIIVGSCGGAVRCDIILRQELNEIRQL